MQLLTRCLGGWSQLWLNFSTNSSKLAGEPRSSRTNSPASSQFTISTSSSVGSASHVQAVLRPLGVVGVRPNATPKEEELRLQERDVPRRQEAHVVQKVNPIPRGQLLRDWSVRVAHVSVLAMWVDINSVEASQRLLVLAQHVVRLLDVAELRAEVVRDLLCVARHVTS
eukprot:1223215-Prymnesium_polylepis.2